ncbi:MAG TPA: peptide MFS transporter [Bryobacteraceae bacterium]|nr:peptide MFS transporter [Bryobacteraceae bacterium]
MRPSTPSSSGTISPTPPNVADPSIAAWDRSFFGHPRGLSALFFTEMWERFSYYGMRALLILFMTATTTHGGLGFPTSKAGAIYGLYTSLVFLCSLPGGWIADRILGQRKATLWGGVFIALGEYGLAIPRMEAFYGGLALIVLGTGLLKPNISTMVGQLYSEKDPRRDAGFSIFYMGINIGALLAPLVCGYLGENIDWHYGFLAAGVGMTFGVIQYVVSGKYLGKTGLEASRTPEDLRLFRRSLAIGGVLVAAVAVLILTGAVSISANSLSDIFGVLLAGIVIAFFLWLLNAKGYSALERRRFWAILVLFIASALFWSAFEQAGSTLNLFAERNTNLHQWDFPLWGLFRASYYQSFNSVFLVALAPVFAWLWIRLGSREPSSTAKFSWGLVFVALGFAILIPVAGSTHASPWWLTLTYLCHTIGELCLSPVGLSAMTKLAPSRIAGLMMGVWFLSISVGDYIGGRLASVYESFPLPLLFGIVAGFCSAVAVLLLFLIRPMKRLMGGVN